MTVSEASIPQNGTGTEGGHHVRWGRMLHRLLLFRVVVRLPARAFSVATTPDRTTDLTQEDAKSSELPSGWKGIKRFYDEVNVRPVDATGTETQVEEASGFRIVIRGRELRTNGMNELTASMRAAVSRCQCASLTARALQVPTYGLALAIAGEFAAQGDMIHPPSLPLVTSPRVYAYAGC